MKQTETVQGDVTETEKHFFFLFILTEVICVGVKTTKTWPASQAPWLWVNSG